MFGIIRMRSRYLFLTFGNLISIKCEINLYRKDDDAQRDTRNN